MICWEPELDSVISEDASTCCCPVSVLVSVFDPTVLVLGEDGLFLPVNTISIQIDKSITAIAIDEIIIILEFIYNTLNF
jgi:hypothetical protein